MINVIRILLNRDNWQRSGLLTLTAAVQTPMIPNSTVVQVVTPENMKKVHQFVLAIHNVKEIIDIFILHEKAVFEIGTKFAHSGSKTRTCELFCELF